ncbi:MAG: IS66 family insertion sequence element accessory protein TnpB [Treponema sp.]|nr:IS66 family insertion sequence element accessory protein TnpB [Treponema sp.]
MKIDFSNTRIFIRPGATNMHKSFEGLTEVIKNTMKLNQYDKDCVFLFCNSTRNIIKAIWWSGNGFWIAAKRLERERWPWPQTQEEAMEIKNEDLELLLKGINVWKRHSELHYEI